MRSRRLIALFILSNFAFAINDANSQGISPPPAIANKSAGDVNFATGAFQKSENPDLLIGGNDLSSGIQFSRSYQSDLASAFSSGFKSQGWTHNLHVTVSNKRAVTPNRTWAAGKEPWITSISVGGRSISFSGGSTNPTGGFGGTYGPITHRSTKLTYSGTQQAGTFTFTDKDGSVLTITNLLMQKWVMPNGTILKYNYNADRVLSSITSNRGYALVFEGQNQWTKACTVNLSATPWAVGSGCPLGQPYVEFQYSADKLNLIGVRDVIGNYTTYEYVTSGGRQHMSCIKRPGSGVCEVSNTYGFCKRDPALSQDPSDLHLMDRVIRQELGTGEVLSYTYAADPWCPSLQGGGIGGNTTTLSIAGVGDTIVGTNETGAPTYFRNSLGHVTTSEYGSSIYNIGTVDPAKIIFPEGDSAIYAYSSGNLTSLRRTPKTGSQLAEILQSATYPLSTSCTASTCNKPLSMTDANGATTSYTYDQNHGGLIAETSPQNDQGISAVRRIRYIQRMAWIANSAGGFQQTGEPIWLIKDEKTCRSTATNGESCAGGTSDEVTISYDYGPDNGTFGNNLFVRGITVTADGQARRTCYGYDGQGNRIWETKPRAGLGVCQ